ncbi:hypothetical protein GIB67_005787 [Kingdonia uniflora]|uniref:Glycosyltransferase n=1 Tax=Kingdonia uniflora TaxID=39325 RepID=A0A7J7KVK3_9MAGN|nr:hypothetical protein GIB67_005787 [Kingdonia uniflora]
MASQKHQQLHFILFPLMAQGHLIPMVDIAKLLAQRDVIVTIVATPLNISRFQKTVDCAIESGLHIRILELKFPCKEVGLPEGCESLDLLSSRDLMKTFFEAISMLQQPLEQSMGEMQPAPSCIISDMGFPWTSETAKKFQIPRIAFHGTSCFSLLCSHNILHYKVRDTITSDSDLVVVPGLPDRIEIRVAHLPRSLYTSPMDLKALIDQIREAELTAYGVVVNSFHDLEPRYVEEYKKAKGNKIWCLGPVSLCNKEAVDKVDRGKKTSIDEHQCLKWLDSRDPNSVIYVCLGSLCRLIASQFIEIGLGLEASRCPFVWVIRDDERYSDLEKWLSEMQFEERTKDRGLIIRGWAPQVLILTHKAVGGFLTHCGWNSTLEGVSAGVPMVTWPMFAEQFINEKMIVQVLGIGVRVGVDVPVIWGDEEKVGVVVKKENIEKAVNEVMDESEEGGKRRKKANELGKKARIAMEEGGSSHLNITLFVQDIMLQTSKKY